MTTIERQLAQYGRRQRELHGPITSDELATRLDRLDDPARIGPDDVLAADAVGLAIASSERHTGENEPDEGDLIMVDIQTRPTDIDPSSRRWVPYLLAAAAAAALMVGTVALFGGTDNASDIDITDNPTAMSRNPCRKGRNRPRTPSRMSTEPRTNAPMRNASPSIDSEDIRRVLVCDQRQSYR